MTSFSAINDVVNVLPSNFYLGVKIVLNLRNIVQMAPGINILTEWYNAGEIGSAVNMSNECNLLTDYVVSMHSARRLHRPISTIALLLTVF